MFDAIKKFLSYKPRGWANRTSILTNDTSLQYLLDGEVACTILWSDIDEVIVFKRDLYTVDLLCLAIRTGETILELTEEMQGWKELVEDVLPQHLQNSIPFANWFLYVAFPAFEAKPLVIYQKGEILTLREMQL